MHSLENSRIGVLGLGYIGLPLAIEFGKQFAVVGFDIDQDRIRALRDGNDRTGEISSAEIRGSGHLMLSHVEKDLEGCNIFVITVPTPVDDANRPDFEPLLSASATVGRCLKKGDLVIYESTVYPGTTEEICVPILEKHSGLVFNRDFFCGYSPERINPGDKERRLADIKKVTSGSTPMAADQVDALYRKIIVAGTHRAPSIKVAEASKVIENIQRDVNIALVNELAMIFNKMGIDTRDVLDAAGTKWNFLPFKPGLVGGHCIGVDPYYLTHKATVLGYYPELILQARRINGRMGIHVAHQVLRLMAGKRINVVGSRILLLGVSFKENCSDIRNTRVIDIINELEAAHAQVDVHDPVVDADEAKRLLRIDLVSVPRTNEYDAIVLAVAHSHFIDAGVRAIRAFGKAQCVIYDVKSVYDSEHVDGRL